MMILSLKSEDYTDNVIIDHELINSDMRVTYSLFLSSFSDHLRTVQASRRASILVSVLERNGFWIPISLTRWSKQSTQ